MGAGLWPARRAIPAPAAEDRRDLRFAHVQNPGRQELEPGRSPEIVLSISPPPGATVDSFPLLGRLYFGEPRLNSEGNTVLRALRGNFCTAVLSRGDRPPPPVNCVTGKNFS